MKNHKTRILVYSLAILSLLATAGLYPLLPEQIPTHWNTDGTVTYSGKHMIFLTAGLGLVLAFLFDFLPKVDPRRQNYQKFGHYYDFFCILMQFFLLAMNGIAITEAFRPGTVSVPMATMLGMGLLFLIIGNMMPKFKSNFYMGIKTPWTISSEEVWRKTHRFGGKCFFLAGLICILCGLLPLKSSVLYSCCTVVVLAAAFVPGLMSYIWWRQEQRETS